jgi:hypothetical protein
LNDPPRGWNDTRFSTLARGTAFGVKYKKRVGEIGSVRLQEHASHGGFTDIELTAENAQVIIEAKRGWNLPFNAQLERYAPRFDARTTDNAVMVLAECDKDYARARLPRRVGRVPVRYLSWCDVYELTRASIRTSNNAQKHILRELMTYVKGLMNMQDQESNLAYTVVLNADRPRYSPVTFVEFVTLKRRYFHPRGVNGWPTEPPNFLAFRFKGKLLSVHHVDHYDIDDDLSKYIDGIDGKQWLRRKVGTMLIYKLGPPILPAHDVTVGKIYATGRYWIALDLLLTCKTIFEARNLTKKRLER